MNKKGFTLVELLAVIGLIAAFALITIPTVDSLLKKQKQKLYEGHKKDITEALKLWGNMNIELLPEEDDESITVTLYDLKIFGLTVDDMTNPKTNKCYANNNTFTITKNKGGYIYIVDDLTDGNTNDCTSSAPTDEDCFIFNETTKTIMAYDFENSYCSNNIKIPNTIHGIPVENIGTYSFYYMGAGQFLLAAYHDVNKGLDYIDKIQNLLILGIEIEDMNNQEYMAIENYNQLEKKCYYGVVDGEGNYPFDMKDINYTIKIPDKYFGCYVDINNVTHSPIENFSEIILGPIRSVDFSNNTHLKTIGIGSFAYNSIQTINFGNSITDIETGSFAFNSISTLEIPSSVKTIKSNSFLSAGISSLTLNEGIETIEPYAFSYNCITDFALPSTLVNYDDSSFENQCVPFN